MTAATRTTAWNFAQGVVTSLLLAAFFLVARLHASAAIPYNVNGYCRACAEYAWAFICWTQGCW